MILEVLQHTVLITSFVFVIMLLVEYLNVQTKGKWQKTIKKNKPVQYIVSAVLGGIPGCLGRFGLLTWCGQFWCTCYNDDCNER